ncbi:MAG: phosphoglycerate mutase family protein [Rhizobium sp.]|nr:phosphoglycerate mutase family protein [Rhizobium sp.]
MTHYIIRHGQTDWNAEARLQGQKNIPLNDFGRQQARDNGVRLKALAGTLDGYDFVASPLDRARETMELARRAAGLDPLTYRIDERLKEICFGDWEGFTGREIKALNRERHRERQQKKWDFLPPGELAESYEILSWRVGSWLKSLNQPTVAVCHGGVIRCIFKLVGGVAREDAANIDIPQDRVLVYSADRVEWA